MSNPLSLQPGGVNFRYNKLRLFNILAFMFYNVKGLRSGLRHWVAKING